MATLTDAGTCRYCRQPLRHKVLRDDYGQTFDYYLGRDADGILDSICWADSAPTRPCDVCEGTGRDTDGSGHDCSTCCGDKVVADHQPA
jgi:hypothetical protein